MTLSLSSVSNVPRFGNMSTWQKGAAALGVAGAALLGSQMVPLAADPTTRAIVKTDSTTKAIVKEEDDIKLVVNLQAQFKSQKSADLKYKLLMKAMNHLNEEGWKIHGDWILSTMNPDSKDSVNYSDIQKSGMIARLTSAAIANSSERIPFYTLHQVNASTADAKLQNSTRRFLALAELYKDYRYNKDVRHISADNLEEYYKLQSELTPRE